MTPTLAANDATLHHDFLAARQGDRQAFARLVQATQRMVTSVALAVTRDIQLSEDIAQETYLKAWSALEAIRTPDSFLPWLRQVTRNRAIDQLRHRQRQQLVPGNPEDHLADAPDHGPDPEATLAGAEEMQLLARALDAIPDDSRDVLLLFHREGQSSQQVAALLGLTDAAVRKRLQRAREAVQAHVLASVGEIARYSAPGLAFTTIVTASLATAPAKAAGAGAATASATAGKWALGAVGSALAAIGLMLAAVVWEARGYIRRARNPTERRELVVHAIMFGTLMASFVAMLSWSKHAQWVFTTTLAVSAIYALLIIAMGVRRHRIHRRHRVPKVD